tara:strand:- start:2580 stop:5189 length:2610 start_codon:yes stop_codon:yes gene_type:complete
VWIDKFMRRPFSYKKPFILFVFIVFISSITGQKSDTLKYSSHLVKKGETVYSISRKYNLSVDELNKLNPKSENVIKIGEVLKVPFIKEESLTVIATETQKKDPVPEKKHNSSFYIKEPNFKDCICSGLKKSNAFNVSKSSGLYYDDKEMEVVISKKAINQYNIYSITASGVNKADSDTIIINEPTILKINIEDSAGNKKCFVGSYIVNVNHKLPVVSLYVKHNEFFPSKGIYHGISKKDTATGKVITIGNSWKKKPIEAFAQFFFNHSLIDELPLDVKTYGGMTLGWKEKSLQLSARKEKYNRGKINVKLFKNLAVNEFQHVVLRTSGNDQNKTRLLDKSISHVADDINLNTKASRSVILYVNGQYFGIHNLREKVNSDYFKYRYQWKNDEFIELQGSGYKNKNFKSVVDYAKKHFNDSNFVAKISETVDVDDFFNFHAIQTYISNPDCRGNIRFYKHEDNKWKWVIYDTDLSCGHNFIRRNFIKDKTFPGYRYWYNPGYSTDLLNSMLKNSDLKEKFLVQYCYLLATYLKKENFEEKILSNRNIIEEELTTHFLRRNHLYRESISNYNKRVNGIIKYFSKRDPTIHSHLEKAFNVKNTQHIKISQNIADFKGIRIKHSNLSTNKIDGLFFQEFLPEIKINIPNHKYKFDEWSDGVKDSIRKLNLIDTALVALFKHVDTSLQYKNVQLTTYFVKSDAKKPFYFIAAENKSDSEINLSNYTLYEDISRLAYNFDSTVLMPGESIILTNKESFFKKKINNDTIQTLAFNLNTNYPNEVSFVLRDDKGLYLDEFFINHTDSLFVSSKNYLFSKSDENEITAINTKVKELINLDFGYEIQVKENVNGFLTSILLIITFLMCFFMFFIVKRHYN